MSGLPSSGSEILDALYRDDHDAVAAELAERPSLTVFEASAVGDLGRVRELVLIEPGLVEQWSPDGFTALQLAAFFGHEEIVGLLLEAGADAGAVARNSLRVQAIHSAAAGGHTAIVKILLDHGADPNVRQEGGFAPIHEAAQSGEDELYDLLVSNGADETALTDDGRAVADFRAVDGE